MNELQKLLLKLKAKRDEVKAVFDKYDDVATMTTDDLAAVKSANTEIAALETKTKELEELEAIKSANKAGLDNFKHHVADDTRPGAPAATKTIEFARVASVKNFKGEVGGRKSDERAYRFGKWIAAAIGGSDSAKRFCNDHGLELKAHSEGTNTAGGYLVPTEFSNDMIDLREQYGVARKLAKVVPMSSDTLLVPRRNTGLTTYWVGEATAITESSKSWSQVQLVAKKLGCLALYSSELNEDAMVAIGDDLAGEIAYAFSYTEDNCYINGDGTSTYGGITGVRQKLSDVSGTIASIKGLTVATGTGYGSAYSSIVLSDFHKVISTLPLYARNGARWVVSSVFNDQIMQKLQTAAGGNVVANIAAGGQMTFLGFPVELSQVMPTTSAVSQVAALFGNFAMGSTFGDRRNMTLAYSTDYKFAEDQLAIKGTERIDINVHSVGDTSVAGPIVGLITGAS